MEHTIVRRPEETLSAYPMNICILRSVAIHPSLCAAWILRFAMVFLFDYAWSAQGLFAAEATVDKHAWLDASRSVGGTSKLAS